MGTPAFAVPILARLLEIADVVGVVTQPDRPAGRGQTLRPSPVKQLAESAGIPLYQPASLRKPETAAPIRAWQPDAIVVAAYGQILRPHLLQLPPLGCLNVHASLLPRWRGASPIQHAILAGDAATGISLMQMDEGMDTGPVYVQEALPIHPGETAATLHDRLAALGAEMISRHLRAILAGETDPAPQDDAAATYAPLIKKADGRLDWTLPATEIDRRVRAMTPWPGAYTLWHGRRLKILEAVACPAAPHRGDTAGTVAAPHYGDTVGTVAATADGVLVRCGVGSLQLLHVQLAGKRATEVDDFVNGRPDFIGATLDA